MVPALTRMMFASSTYYRYDSIFRPVDAASIVIALMIWLSTATLFQLLWLVRFTGLERMIRFYTNITSLSSRISMVCIFHSRSCCNTLVSFKCVKSSFSWNAWWTRYKFSTGRNCLRNRQYHLQAFRVVHVFIVLAVLKLFFKSEIKNIYTGAC